MMSKHTKPTQDSYEKSFAEALITDAFNPGVHRQSFDAINYALAGLFIVGAVSIYLSGGNWHLVVLIVLGGGLAFFINKYRDDLLAASEEYKAKKAKEEAELEDEDYEDEDEDNEEAEVEEQESESSERNKPEERVLRRGG